MIGDLLNRYYAALATKSGWEEFVSDSIRFVSRIATTEGKEAFLQGNGRFLRAVKSMARKHTLTDGDTACVWVAYDLVSPKGSEETQDVVEIWTERGGRLAACTVYFDTTAFSSLMSR